MPSSGLVTFLACEVKETCGNLQSIGLGSVGSIYIVLAAFHTLLNEGQCGPPESCTVTALYAPSLQDVRQRAVVKDALH